jgi:hypothetical protein
MSKEELKEWAVWEVEHANSIIKRYRSILEDSDRKSYRDTVYFYKGYRNALLTIIQTFADPEYPTEEEYISWPH